MYLLVEVFEFAPGISQEELALDPDGEAENVGEEQSSIDRDALEVAVQDEAAPRHKEMQLVHEPETEREEDERGEENGISEHECLNLRGLHGRLRYVLRSSA